jgi:hypothetical protein
MLKIIVLGCVLLALAVALKVRLETPQGWQPLARANRHQPSASGEGRAGAALSARQFTSWNAGCLGRFPSDPPRSLRMTLNVTPVTVPG